ncbi:MAG: hypothetical protein U9Q92_02195 [archaeon]|nr:hypothetical protein [archaeon]
MKTKAFIVSFLLVLLAVPVMSYAATVTVSQSGADTGTVIKGRTFNIQVSGLSGSGSVNLIDLPSGFSTEEGASKSFSEGTASVTWTTAEISQTQSDVKIKASIQITGSPSTAESSSFDVVLPPSISLSVTPTSYSNVAAGSGKVFNLDIPNTGGTSAKSVALTVLGGGASIQSGCDTISSVSAGGSSSLTCTVSFTSSATATFTATPSNADSKSDTVSITVQQPASGETPGDTSPGTGPGGTPVLPPAEEDEEDNVTTQKQKKEKPKEEKVTASNRPDIVPGVGLRNNTKLQAALAKVLGQAKMSIRAMENMQRLSAAIISEIETERNFEATGESSKITTKMKYNGNKKAKNFIVYEKIPKSFAESADEITVNTQGKVEIVEKDPEYAIIFSELNPGQSIDISYTVNKKVDASVIDTMATEVYAESIGESPSEAQPPTTTQPEDKGISPVLVFIIILVLVAVAGYIIIKKRQKKLEPFRPGPAQQPEEEKPETSSEEIDEVKDKITD